MIKKTLIIVLFLGISTGIGFSQEAKPVSADQVINNYISAIGGIDRIKQIQSIKTLYKVHMQSMPAYQVERTVNRKGELKSGRTKGKRHLFFDGQKLWNVQGESRTELKGDVVNQFRKKADLDGPLIDHKKKGITIRYLGKERIEFSQFLKLEVTWPDKINHVLYFDQKSGLLKKRKEPAYKMDNGKVVRAADTITSYYDYRDVDGIKAPFYWVQTTADLQHVHLFTVDSIEVK